jgi:3-hydroxyacyl-[acyl-carrier-protein] dehydratase
MKHVERLEISPDHPAYADHFPGAPILPGVVLLDAALLAMQAALRLDLAACRISAVKFHAIVRPADRLRIEYQAAPNASIQFSILDDERRVVSGTLCDAR